MNKVLASVVLFAFTCLLSACADHRVNRPDEDAMMIYRECMAGMPGAVTPAAMSNTISSSPSANENTSIAANARTRQEQDHEIYCMQQAGWEN